MAVGNGSALQDLRAARRALQDVRGKQKLDFFINAKDPRALVQSLPPEELYLALLDIGPDDATDLIALSTPQQFRHFIDMAAWPKSDEGPRSSEILRWVRLAREGVGRSDASMARFRRQLASLDLEMMALLLRREMTVYDLAEDDQPNAQDEALIYFTSDRRFMLEFGSQDSYAAMKQLIEDLYEQDVFATGRLIESIRWEVPTELEETARRWRDGRLRDLGVPDFEEAISFYARPAERARNEAAAGHAGTALLTPQGSLVDAAMELLSGEDLEAAEESVIYAANAALVANRVPLDDADEVREQLTQSRATLGLGLELLSAGDPARAARLLADEPIRKIFQAAMGEVYALQTRARRIAASARLPQAQSATLLDRPLSGVIEALLKPRPTFGDPGARRPRAFGSRADLAHGAALLDDSEATVALLGALGIAPAVLGPQAELAGLGPSALTASAAVRALVESRMRGLPLTLLLAGEKERPLDPGFRAALEEALALAATSAPLRRAADRLLAVLCP